jgi:large subunit ribosomal protein L23
MLEVIKRPIVTEKAMKLGELRQYVFEVDRSANKIDIKKAVEKMFEVNVISVRTTVVKPKMKMRITKRGVVHGKSPSYKKAYVTLKVGQTIELVTGGA